MINFPVEYRVSELCFEYRFDNQITTETSQRVLQVYQYLLSDPFIKTSAVRDIIPTYTTLALHLSQESPFLYNRERLYQCFEAALHQPLSLHGEHHMIDVSYNGPDLENVASMLQCSCKELIRLHVKPRYRIAMIGFRPYFPYLMGLNPRLQLPRRTAPRKEVPKGSVAIADLQTGIYSQNSPGGWHLIGQTNFQDFATLQPGDTVTFRELKC